MKLTEVSKQLYFCAIKIDCVDAAGNKSSGTGFYYSHEINDGTHMPLVVTNKHVIAGAIKGTLSFPEGDENGPILGKPVQIEIQNFESQWISHPDQSIDLAALPLAPIFQRLKDIYKRATILCLIPINKSLSATESDLENLSGIEEVAFVGFPNGIWDTKNGVPIIRSESPRVPWRPVGFSQAMTAA